MVCFAILRDVDRFFDTLRSAMTFGLLFAANLARDVPSRCELDHVMPVVGTHLLSAPGKDYCSVRATPALRPAGGPPDGSRSPPRALRVLARARNRRLAGLR